MRCLLDCFGASNDDDSKSNNVTSSSETSHTTNKWSLLRNESNRHFDDVYQIGKKLGSGAFSTVKETTHKQTKTIYAVKIISKPNMSYEDKKSLKCEISILQELNHPNIIQLHEIFNEKDYIYLVTEIMTGGELFDRIVQKEFYNESDAKDVARVLFTALDYCHGLNIAHRDLKPENLLLRNKQNDKDIKVADFGFAKKCLSAHCLLTQCGTPGYVAPEILNGIPYGTKADMWSLGVIVYILLAGYPPFNAKNQRALFKLIRRGQYEFHEKFWSDVSDDAKLFIRKLLVIDPRKRYTARDALDSPWMIELQGQTRNLRHNLIELRKFNAKRKLKQAVFTAIATQKMTHFIGMGVDSTFGFTQAKAALHGCETMSTDNLKN